MILLNLFLLLSGFMCCQTNEWKGIVPLKSTREQVEKQLGKPMPRSVAQDAASYKTNNEKVFVLYSSGQCKSKPSNGWDVPELTVISITVEPDIKPKFADYNFDDAEFERVQDPGTLDGVFYTNEKDGISFMVDTTDKTIGYFSYFPATKDYYLKCEKGERNRTNLSSIIDYRLLSVGGFRFLTAGRDDEQHADFQQQTNSG